MSKLSVEIPIPEKFQILLQPKRYKIFYGGRGGARSWSCARAILILGMQKSLRILCAREFQNSIKDSVYQLLVDQIRQLGLEKIYTIQSTCILGINGTTIHFEGLKRNTINLKSYEGADICWVEEAQTVSKSSWDILIPTIRKKGSEIWITFNPELEEDETYQRFVLSPPKNSIVLKTKWNDNPWFPSVLKQEMEEMKNRDYASYLNVWEGHCRSSVEGAIFAKELQKATEEGRICHVSYNSSVPVNTFWDLGHSDLTAIWFAQLVGFEYHILRYYSNSGEKMAHYLKYVKDLPYVYGTHYLPHDAAHEQLGSEKTIEQQAVAALKEVIVIPRVHAKVNSIEAVRAIFDRCYFDKELCADGLSALRRYAYHVDQETGRVSKEPEHNIFSHASDAFQTLAMAFQEPLRAKPFKRQPRITHDPYEV